MRPFSIDERERERALYNGSVKCNRRRCFVRKFLNGICAAFTLSIAAYAIPLISPKIFAPGRGSTGFVCEYVGEPGGGNLLHPKSQHLGEVRKQFSYPGKHSATQLIPELTWKHMD